MISSSHHIDIDSCTFIDLENLRLGAVKPVSSGTNNITIRNCKFTRVGSGGGCHMIYAAYGPDHIYVIDNIFEDCPGSYVKFRDRADYGYVKGNTFIFTGDFQSYLYDDYKYTPPFILMTVEDDNCNPDGAEYFGTNYEITGNIFQFEDDFSYNHTVIGFFQRVYEECIGYRLVGYNEGMENLTNGTPEQQKWFLKEGKIPWIEIDLDKIICSDNYYNGVDFRAFFESRPVFSHTPGEYWDSLADISIALEAN